MALLSIFVMWFARTFIALNPHSYPTLYRVLPNTFDTKQIPSSLTRKNTKSELERAQRTIEQIGWQKTRQVKSDKYIYFRIYQRINRNKIEWFVENELDAQYQYEFDREHNVHSVVLKPPSNGEYFIVTKDLKQKMQSDLFNKMRISPIFLSQFEYKCIYDPIMSRKYTETIKKLKDFCWNWQYIKYDKNRNAKSNDIKMLLSQYVIESKNNAKKGKNKRIFQKSSSANQRIHKTILSAAGSQNDSRRNRRNQYRNKHTKTFS